MGLRVFDFKCPYGHVTEVFCYESAQAIACPTCEGNGFESVAEKQLSAPRFDLDGCSGDFPTAADAWERKRESHMRKERKNVENHDSYK